MRQSQNGENVNNFFFKTSFLSLKVKSETDFRNHVGGRFTSGFTPEVPRDSGSRYVWTAG